MNALTKPPGAEVLERVDQALIGVAADNLIWLSGYLYGLARQPGAAAPAEPATASISVFYGSQTGNARRLAEAVAEGLKGAGRAAKLTSLGEVRPRDLRGLEYALFVVSTQGDGEPPEDCRDFFAALEGDRAPQLDGLQFAVLALGDSSYPQFCATGKALDQRLEALGAQRAQPRLDADLDFQRSATAWVARWQEALPAAVPVAPAAASVAGASQPNNRSASPTAPVVAEVLSNVPLTAPGALREVRHLELAFDPARLGYQPGDALGLRFANPDQLVAPVLATLEGPADQPIERDGRKAGLEQWLREELELSRISRPLIVAFAEATGAAELQALLEPTVGEQLREYLRQSQLIDLLTAYPGALSAAQLVDLLPPLQHRLYSIASSPGRCPDEVHLTVALRSDERGERTAFGACSTAISALQAGDQVGVWVEPNPRFRLPADGARDVIMIGPGTGVAPFRSFVQERAATGASGRNWLVFGARRRYLDFLYQTEWQEALKRGQLDRLTLAFSRDSAQRTYVQDRLREEGAELYTWIRGGAHLYLCGDAFAMAPAVEAALIEIIAEHGRLEPEQASEQLAQLRREGRWMVDVY